jgi:hypothetical protein
MKRIANIDGTSYQLNFDKGELNADLSSDKVNLLSNLVEGVLIKHCKFCSKIITPFDSEAFKVFHYIDKGRLTSDGYHYSCMKNKISHTVEEKYFR